MTARFDSRSASYTASCCGQSAGTTMSMASEMDTALMLAVSIFVILIGIIGRIICVMLT